MHDTLNMRIAWALLLVLSGCAAQPAPEQDAGRCERQRAFYVVGDDWHTGIVVPGPDLLPLLPGLAQEFSAPPYLEIGWGDERFYRAPEPGVGLALRAALWPTRAVLHVAAITDPRRAFSEKVRVYELTVPESGYQNLLAYLAASFTKAPGGGVLWLGSGLYGHSAFYRAEGRFHVFNTCNTWVARAIAVTGYPIRNARALTAEGVMSQLEDDPKNVCYRAALLSR